MRRPFIQTIKPEQGKLHDFSPLSPNFMVSVLLVVLPEGPSTDFGTDGRLRVACSLDCTADDQATTDNRKDANSALTSNIEPRTSADLYTQPTSEKRSETNGHFRTPISLIRNGRVYFSIFFSAAIPKLPRACRSLRYP